MPAADGPGPGPAPTGSSVVSLVGPTASGKSAVALAVAARMNDTTYGSPGVELVSVDSMAVYRGMDIGTAKPTAEVRARVPYHLVDLVEPSDEFTVQRFQGAALLALEGIAGRGNAALLVGGTGLYLRSVVDDLRFPGRYSEVAATLIAELDRTGPEGSAERQGALRRFHDRLAAADPVAAGRIEATNERRLVRALEVTMGSGQPFSTFGPGLETYPPSQVTLVGLDPGADILDVRIAERFELLMDAGLLDEVRTLVGRPGGMSRTARQALGYRELLAHIEDGVALGDAVELAIQRTRTFARRQRAWFRRDPRILWLAGGDDPVDAVVAALRTVPGAVPGVRE